MSGSPPGAAEAPQAASALGTASVSLAASTVAGSTMTGSQLNTGTGSALRMLIGQKEKELHDMNEYRIQALEGAIAERDQQISELRENFKKLKVDFQYNLQLIQDRDAELQRYDAAFANLKNALRDRDREVSDLKVSVDEVEAQVRAEQQRSSQVEGYCKDKLTEAKERLEGLRLQKDEELRKVRADMDEMRRTFLAQMSAKDELLNTQRRDMSTSFDELARKQEMEAGKREEGLRKELQDAIDKDHQRLEEKMRLDHEMQLLHHSVATLRSQLDAKEADFETREREHKAGMALMKKEMDAAQSAALIASAHSADLAARLLEGERAEKEVERQMEDMREGLEVSHRRALEDQEKCLRQAIRDAEDRCESLATRLASSEGERQRYQQAATRASREVQEQALVHMEALEVMRRTVETCEAKAAEAAQKASMQRAVLEEELAGGRQKMEALKRAAEERRNDIEALRAELQSAGAREEALHRKLAQSQLRVDASDTSAAAEAESKVQERFSELLKAIGLQRDRAVADKELLQEQLAQALKQRDRAFADKELLQEQLQAADSSSGTAAKKLSLTGALKLSIDPLTLQPETPLDSPIQMPPYPETPVPHNHNLTSRLTSRPTTADTDMWRSRPTTADEKEAAHQGICLYVLTQTRTHTHTQYRGTGEGVGI